jgi:nitrogen fixation protein NifU and related proteins
LSEPGPLRYSTTAAEHIRNPRNLGRLDDATAIGTGDDPATENYIAIYLRLERDRLTAVHFRALACSACIAASSITTELTIGRSLAEARQINAEAILTALDGLPESKLHCAELAARALANALAAV